MSGLSIRATTPAPVMETEDQEMVTLNQKLKALGIEQTVELPQICVVGDQSAGKSSLIEALSKIKVPRATQTCTQCPLEINLIKANQPEQSWRCTVTLEKGYKYAPDPVKDKVRPMGPWEELREKVTVPFKEILQKGEVCDIIRRAQLAILNPSTNAASFTTNSYLHTYEAKFSPNVVKLDIEQTEVDGLSFIDLPGMVVTHPDDIMIKLVDNLVESYSKARRTINLLTLPMTQDYHTIKSLGMIEKFQASSRTLAVLTKPDRLSEPEAVTKYLAVLDGKEALPMRHGYHCVMMNPDLSLSHSEFMREEQHFFNTELPWSTFRPERQANIGTDKLFQKLSTLLQRATRQNLPASLQRINSELMKVKLSLEKLPEGPELLFQSQILSSLIRDLEVHLRKLFLDSGSGDDSALKVEWSREAAALRSKLISHFPKLQSWYSSKEEIRMQQASREDVESTSQKVSKSSQAEPVVLDDGDEPARTPRIKRENQPKKRSQPPVLLCHKFSLEEMQAINQKYALPGIVSQACPGASQEMMKLSLEKLHHSANKFMDLIVEMVRKQVLRHATLVFRHYQHLPLFEVVINHLNAFIQKLSITQKENCKQLCQMEQDYPYTLDAVKCARAAEKCKEALTETREENRQYLADLESEASNAHKRGRKPVLKNELPKDEWNTELELLANAQAYYQIAVSRFVDNVCQSVHARMFTALGNTMVEDLSTYLGPLNPERQQDIQEWMTENPERVRRRHELLRQQQSLEEAKKLVQKALACDEDPASVRAGKRKATAAEDGDVEMSGTPTEEGSDTESPSKKTKVGLEMEHR